MWCIVSWYITLFHIVLLYSAWFVYRNVRGVGSFGMCYACVMSGELLFTITVVRMNGQTQWSSYTQAQRCGRSPSTGQGGVDGLRPWVRGWRCVDGVDGPHTTTTPNFTTTSHTHHYHRYPCVCFVQCRVFISL